MTGRTEHYVRTVGTQTVTAVVDVHTDGSGVDTVVVTADLLHNLLQEAGWTHLPTHLVPSTWTTTP